MSKLVEATHVTLGGEIGSPDAWARSYLDDEHARYADKLLTVADALLLGRLTYEGLSVAYTGMAKEAPPGAPSEFIDRMNRIPKFVASRTLRETTWNATVIDDDVATFVDDRYRRASRGTVAFAEEGASDASPRVLSGSLWRGCGWAQCALLGDGLAQRQLEGSW